MIPLRSHVLERPDAVIRYWSGGVSGAPTVVLLHGATLDHRSWQPQIDALHDRFRVVVTDLRGHGVSTGVFDFDAAAPPRSGHGYGSTFRGIHAGPTALSVNAAAR